MLSKAKEIGKALPRQGDVGLSGLGCALLERMDDVDSVFVLRDIKHAVFKFGVYPDLVHAGTNGRHGLPIIGHEALLDSPQLVAGGSPGFGRKRANILERRSKPSQWLLQSWKSIHLFVCRGTLPNMRWSRRRLGWWAPRLSANVRPTRSELLENTIIVGVTTDPEPCDFVLLQ